MPGSHKPYMGAGSEEKAKTRQRRSTLYDSDELRNRVSKYSDDVLLKDFELSDDDLLRNEGLSFISNINNLGEELVAIKDDIEKLKVPKGDKDNPARSCKDLLMCEQRFADGECDQIVFLSTCE